MDFIGALTSKLGLPEAASKAVAGKLLGGVKSGLADKFGADAAAGFDKAVPELEEELKKQGY